MLSKTAILVSCLALATSGFSVRPSSKNTVQDAHEQLTKKIRCWEPVEENIAGTEFSGQHTLSEPIYDLCSYMPDPKDYNKGYVNGVDMESDDYTNVLNLYQIVHKGHAMLNVCLQEAFQFHAAGRPSQTSIRCLCKRDGCNMPKGFTTFLDFNKLPMPETFF
ncbi:Protein CBG11410 [Caenorhabditis briggsae]|uniref:Uncharacterized protein n=2 Tax=Caenorhabditis briggsae TaxID=6238 RepID=A0AAE8ZVD3_CAEBR|nr:Protein CBG11410 [Caenorhabditis briggsae]ULT85931.1 hypothetical protein L3Y34_005961 [Caenorhabditis briggsae]CAP30553.1 Protein CBG11410 [Caenorhabditis briggsae]